MKLADFIAQMERIAPPELALDFDNVGLLIGTERPEINKVLVALDCTAQTAAEAAAWGADLLLTHHPLFFGGVKHILPDDPATAGAYILLRHGIAHYAAHTNLDAAAGGVNDCLAEALGILNAEPIPPEGLSRIGSLAEDMPATLGAYARLVSERLGTAVRVGGNAEAKIAKVAVLGGAAQDGDYDAAWLAGADVFVTGEIKHHHALAAMQRGLHLIEAGHYETERIVLLPLIRRLQECTNDVQYRLTLSQTACLARLS